MKRIVVLGAGGIGTAVGGILSAGRQDVTMITQLPVESEHIERHGLRVTGTVDLTARPRAGTGPVAVGADDVLLVAVKGHQTKDALQRVRGIPAAALSLQNGIEKEVPLTQSFGDTRVICSVVQVTASLQSVGISRCAAIEPSAMSAIHPAGAKIAKEMAEIFSNSGMPTTIVHNAAEVEWAKAAQWLPSSLLTAATGLPLDDVLRDDRLAGAYVSMVRECAAVANAHGVELATFGRLYAAKVARASMGDAIDELVRLGNSMAGGHLAGYRTSMELDIAAGRPPELDSTVGAMQRAARAVNVPSPVLETAAAIVRARTRAERINVEAEL
jgi:2-dehydropantoate 2-reductase